MATHANRSILSLTRPATLLDVADAETEALIAHSGIPSGAYGYATPLRSEKINDLITDLGKNILIESKIGGIRSIEKPQKLSFSHKIYGQSKATKETLQQQQKINKATKHALLLSYQYTPSIDRGADQVNIFRIAAYYYLVEAFSNYLEIDPKSIKKDYSGEAKDFSTRINQLYMHLNPIVKSSLIGQQIKACADNSAQLHLLLKK